MHGLNELQETVDQWVSTHGVRYFNPLTNMALLMEEVGELARIMARTYGEQSAKENEVEDNLADELCDVLFVLTCLANQCEVQLEPSFASNLEKKAKRDHDRHHKNPKLQSGR